MIYNAVEGIGLSIDKRDRRPMGESAFGKRRNVGFESRATFDALSR